MLIVYIWLGIISVFVLILLFMLIKIIRNTQSLLSLMKDELVIMSQKENDRLIQLVNKLEHHEQYFKRIVELEDNTNHIHFLLKEMQSKPKTRKTTKSSASKEKDAD